MEALETNTNQLPQYAVESEVIWNWVKEQKKRNEIRKCLPQALDFFPINKSQILKKTILKLLELLHRDQRSFNLTVIETFQRVIEAFEQAKQREEELIQENRYLRLELTNLHKKIHEIKPLIFSENAHTPVNKSTLSEGVDPRSLDAFFVAFDDTFRGTRKEIAARLEIYLPYIKKIIDESGRKEYSILDLGCGRGEWLELLKINNIRALGVEMNESLVDLCKSLQLDVQSMDAISALKKQPDRSLIAVTAFHVIEHLPFLVLVELVDEILRVLIPGGLFIFETPNPKNYFVSSHNFWLDPTHLKPIPSLFLKFLVEARGAKKAEVLELHPLSKPWEAKEGFLAEQLNSLLYGPQDYAIIGQRSF